MIPAAAIDGREMPKSSKHGTISSWVQISLLASMYLEWRAGPLWGVGFMDIIAHAYVQLEMNKQRQRRAISLIYVHAREQLQRLSVRSDQIAAFGRTYWYVQVPFGLYWIFLFCTVCIVRRSPVAHS